MIRADVKTVTMSRAGFVVLLEGVGDERVLPIHIGPPEAQAILLFLNDVPVERPLTHDLFRSVLQTMGAQLDKITVCDLRQETFYATMTLAVGKKTLDVDCRPSDGIALALRCAAPIFVEDSVMEQAGILLQESEDGFTGVRAGDEELETEEPATATMESPGKRLRKELDKAVAEERYEDAAALRDRMRRDTE